MSTTAPRLEIREQPRLSWRKQADICADGIQHRLFRSLITLSVVVLAVAFLMNVITESVVAQALKRSVGQQADGAVLVGRFTAWLAGPIDAGQMQAKLAAAGEADWSGPTLRNWLGLKDSEFASASETARQWQHRERWLTELGLGYRRLLLDRRDDEEVWAWLATDDGGAAFVQRLRQIGAVRTPDDLVAAAQTRSAWRQRLEGMTQLFNDHLAGIGRDLKGDTLRRRLLTISGEVEQKAMGDLLQGSGVRMDVGLRDQIFLQARQESEHERVRRLASRPDIGQAWQRQFSQIAQFETMVAELASRPERAQWLAEQDSQANLTAAVVQQAATRMVAQRVLSAMRDRLAATYGDSAGLGSSVIWLIVVSLLVCAVGITNAMLVSVIERFREIATMKCLGALDGFIATLFMMEAALLGVVGGIAGVVLGGIIGLARMAVGYGAWLRFGLAWDGLLLAAAVSVLAGVLLATLASIYPAVRASQMPPMEAMRVE